MSAASGCSTGAGPAATCWSCPSGTASQVDPDAYVEDLPVGVQQRVEIIKALLRNANVLVLDEPTAVLTPHETEDLFRIMRELREGGRSIIFISHKLKEVQAIADNITVIRRGKVVGDRPPSTSDTELAALMVGRSVQLRVSKDEARPGDVRLKVDGLTVPGELGGTVVEQICPSRCAAGRFSASPACRATARPSCARR